MWSYTYKHGDRPLDGLHDPARRRPRRVRRGLLRRLRRRPRGRPQGHHRVRADRAARHRPVHEPQEPAPGDDLRRQAERRGPLVRASWSSSSGLNLRELLDAVARGPGHAEGGVLPPRDRQGPELPARLRHRPPRPQARQHLLRKRLREDRRLRPEQGHRSRRTTAGRRSPSARCTTWRRRSASASTTARSTSTRWARCCTRCSPAWCRSSAPARARS